MEGVKRKIIVVVGLVLVMLCGSFYGYIEKTKAVNKTEILEQTEMGPRSDDTATVTVYISGAVAHPGIYKVKAGCRVIDALPAAGGLLESADQDRVNMAKKVKDGMHIRVWEKSRRGGAGSRNEPLKTSLPQGDDQININTADADSLKRLPGIGPETARRIVEYRNIHGAFKNIDDLRNVSGIGPGKMQNLRSRVTL